MTQIKKIEDLEGKTLQKVAMSFDGELFLLFEDDTYACFETEHDYDGCASVSLKTTAPDDYNLREVGLITEEEHARRRAVQEESRKKAQERRERSQYEQLKKKFG